MDKIDEKTLKRLVARQDDKVKMGEELSRPDYCRVLLFNEATKEFEDTEKGACTKCWTLLSIQAGNHVTRHFEKTCRKRTKEESEKSASEPEVKSRKMTAINFSTKKYKDSEVKKVTDALAKYCLRSGKSFNHVASTAMKSLILDITNSLSCGYGDAATSQLPCRNTIQKSSELLAKEIVKKVTDNVKKFVGNRMNLLVDHGKLVVNYLSIFGSFLNDDVKLVIVPLAFMPCLDGKSGRETANCIIEKLQSFGWLEEDIVKCSITADGALSTLSGFFKSYVRCVNHSLNLVAQHMVVPLDAHFMELLPVSKQLEKVSRLFKLAQIISGGLRGNVNACQNLSRLPALPIETRWMNGLKCLKDILILSDEISLVIGMLPTKVRSAHHELFNESLKVAKSTLLVMEPLLDYNQLYQTQSEVTIHLVLPTYKLLETRFNSFLSGKFDDVSLYDLDSICSDTVDALSRSGLAVLPHYYKEFDSVHFAAVYLSPKTKKMLSFSCSERQKAKGYILSLLPQEIRLPVTSKTNKSSSSVSKLLSLVSDVSESSGETTSELERYESEHVDALSNESVEDYWKSRRSVYPHLFDVALQVLSVVPSESVCESAFSQAAFLLDKRRTRLSYLKAEYVVLRTQLATKYPEILP